MSIKFIEHTADIAVEVAGGTIEELFMEAASAWLQSVAEDYKPELAEENTINLSEDTLEELMVNFLQELNFLLFTRKWIFNKVNELKINSNGRWWDLYAQILGENTNEERHILKEEIKAVTFHQMKIEHKNGLYSTKIIFDI